jgi:hypothetical protein
MFPTTNLSKKQASQTNKKQTIDHKFYATKKRRQSQKMQALGNLICDTIAMRERESGDDDIEKRLGKGGEWEERGAQSEEVLQEQSIHAMEKTKETLSNSSVVIYDHFLKLGTYLPTYLPLS